MDHMTTSDTGLAGCVTQLQQLNPKICECVTMGEEWYKGGTATNSVLFVVLF